MTTCAETAGGKQCTGDGTFSLGRAMVRPGVRAEWNRKYCVEAQFTQYAGGRYKLLVDRDHVSAVAGMRF